MGKLSKLEQRMGPFSSTSGALKSIKGASGTESEEGSAFLSQQPMRSNERFFVAFATCCDSHQLSSHLQTFVLAELERLSNETDSISVENLADRVNASITLSRFLGFLIFSPRSASGRIIDRHKNSSLAFESLHRSLVSTANFALGGLSVPTFLASSCENGNITLVVPWLCAFLRMAEPDSTMRDTAVFRESLNLLYWVRGSRRLSKSYGSLRCIAELDSLFDLFAFKPSDESQTEISHTWAKRNAPPLDGQLDSLNDVFDQCPVESCELLDRVYQAFDRSRAFKPNSVAVSPAPPNPVKQRQMLISLPRPSSTHASSDANIDKLMVSFLHHDADVARVVAFAVSSLPENAASMVVAQCIQGT